MFRSIRFAAVCLTTLTLLVWACSEDDSGSDSGDDCVGEGCDTDDRRNRDRNSDRDAGSDTDDGGANDRGNNGDDAGGGDDMGGGDDTGGVPDISDGECGPGFVEGRVCAPSEQVWIGGATVTIAGTDCDGNAFELETVSDSEGFWEFESVPSGTHDVTITKGSFETVVDVVVRNGGRTDLVTGEEKACLVDDSIEIAVVGGEFDSIEGVLDVLGLEYDFYPGEQDSSPAEALLLDAGAMSAYDIIFLNCGQQDTFFGFLASDTEAVWATMGGNIRTFVEAGGSLYASDWMAFLLERAYPDIATFSDNDPNINDSRRGAMGSVSATVVDDALEAALGASSLNIELPQQGWAFAQSVSDDVVPLVVAPTVRNIAGDTFTDVPMLFRYQPSATAGRVYYTSFHNEAQLEEEIARVLRDIVFSL